MARVSRYNNSQEARSSKYLWRAGLYCRLSKEDLNKPTFNESDSIESQKFIQEDYLSTVDDIQVVDEYIDDGFTGGNEDRPEFKRMLADVESGKINCIIVKDLSRFVRDDYAQSKYTQIIFAKGQIRFIAILDRVDSEKNPDSVHNPKTKMKAVYNENILRETSRKVLNILDMKREEGEFIGAFASYGYKKDPCNHNKLVIDNEAAEIVRLIYKMFLEGMSIRRITLNLNDLGIPNPSMYKNINGYKYVNSSDKFKQGFWCDVTVRNILNNRIYCGDMVQGKRRKINYKVKSFANVPESKWFIKENTHEPIIDKDTFFIVQSLLKRDTRTTPNKKLLTLFAGFLRCADCKRALIKKNPHNKNLNYHYYVCGTYEKISKKNCSRHGIRSDILEKTVFTVISQQISMALDMDKLIKEINTRPEKKAATDYLQIAIKINENEKNKIEKILFDLYPDFKSGLISQAIYIQQQQRYESELSNIKSRLDELNKRLEIEKNGIDNSNSFVKNFVKFKNIQALTREVLASLVDCIYIEENGGIIIDFRFKDAYISAVEYIERNNDLNIQEIFKKVTEGTSEISAKEA